jgi:hypothetical protein
MFRPARSLFAFAACALTTCNPPRPSPTRVQHDARAVRAQEPSLAPTGIRFVHADPTGEVAEIVLRVRGETERAHRRLLVYVGATWCEPCQYFHRAADAHALDAAFPDLTLLEFDLDRDAARLQRAGYVSQMIPLFTRPGPDGRATAQHIEGSIHGPGSVAQIEPRLRALLE